MDVRQRKKGIGKWGKGARRDGLPGRGKMKLEEYLSGVGFDVSISSMKGPVIRGGAGSFLQTKSLIGHAISGLSTPSALTEIQRQLYQTDIDEQDYSV